MSPSHSLTPVPVWGCPAKYLPFHLGTFKASKMSQGGCFPLCSASEVPWLPPQIFMLGKQKHTEAELACVYQPATTKGDDAVSHRCNLNLHSRARHLKGAERRRGPNLEKGQLCPTAVLSSHHLSVKTLVA